MAEFKDFKSSRQAVYTAFLQAKGARQKERYYCILLAYDGLTLSQIVATVGRQYTTVRDWIELFNQGGLEGLQLGKDRGGRVGRLQHGQADRPWQPRGHRD